MVTGITPTARWRRDLAAKLSARDVEQPPELLDEILASPGVRVIDDHGHAVALSGRLAEFFRAAVAAASSGEALLFSEDETMSPTDAARALGVSRPMVYRYIQQGLLEDQPVNSYHRVPAASVYRLADQRRGAAQRAAELLEQEPEHPRVVAARERVRARRTDRQA
jgi:predicted transcriptional regulator